SSRDLSPFFTMTRTSENVTGAVDGTGGAAGAGTGAVVSGVAPGTVPRAPRAPGVVAVPAVAPGRFGSVPAARPPGFTGGGVPAAGAAVPSALGAAGGA